MPPTPSGVADYSARLLKELVNHVDVDVFVNGSAAEFEPLGSEGLNLKRRESFTLLDSLGAYDEVVYCMGNSEFHGYVYETLLQRPGVVLAHEVRFNGFYSWYGENRMADPSFFNRSIVAQHPNAPSTLGIGGSIASAEADRFGIYMVSELVELSTVFLVHSEYAATVARLHSSASGRIAAIPFGIPDPVPSKESHRSSSPLVVTIGIAAPVKKTDTFVEAAQFIIERVPDAQFAIVGYIPADYRDEIENLAAAVGVWDRLTITDHVSPEEYELWLTRADVAVQLRSSSNGETSAAVADCFRHGIPTVVTNIGPAREYPHHVVYPLPVDAIPEQLADAVTELLSNQDLAGSYSQSALEFTRRSSFEEAARRLIEAIGLKTRSDLALAR